MSRCIPARCTRRPVSTLSPYTTLFRSGIAREFAVVRQKVVDFVGRESKPESAVGVLQRRSRACSRARRNRLRSEEHTSELQSLTNLVCRLLLEKKKKTADNTPTNAI